MQVESGEHTPIQPKQKKNLFRHYICVCICYIFKPGHNIYKIIFFSCYSFPFCIPTHSLTLCAYIYLPNFFRNRNLFTHVILVRATTTTTTYPRIIFSHTRTRRVYLTCYKTFIPSCSYLIRAHSLRVILHHIVCNAFYIFLGFVTSDCIRTI